MILSRHGEKGRWCLGKVDVVNVTCHGDTFQRFVGLPNRFVVCCCGWIGSSNSGIEDLESKLDMHLRGILILLSRGQHEPIWIH